MKIFAFIMAFVVVALSIMPCADKVNIAKQGSGMVQSGQHQNGDQDDDCSPFCHCTCCAGFSITHFVTSIKVLPLLSNTPQCNLTSSECTQVASVIWQPPRNC